MCLQIGDMVVIQRVLYIQKKTKLYLFDYGNMFTGATGGWVDDKQNAKGASITTNSDGTVKVTPVASGYGASIYRTAKRIDLTEWNTLHFYGVLYEYNSNGHCGFGVFENDKTTATDTTVALTKPAANQNVREVTLDVSSITGSHYIERG